MNSFNIPDDIVVDEEKEGEVNILSRNILRLSRQFLESLNT